MAPFTKPIRITVESDGTGSASFGWSHVIDTFGEQFVHHIEQSLHVQAQLLGMRFVDGDGRPTAGPVPGGVVLVGFAARRDPRPTPAPSFPTPNKGVVST